MFKNYLKTALRNINRHKGFSMINIAGLSLGLTACIMIGLFVWDEHQFDRFISNGDQVYRVYSEYTNTVETQTLAATPPTFATSLQRDFPEVETTTRVMMMAPNKTLFETKEKKLYEENACFADSTFLNVFPLKFIYGSPARALDELNGIVISQNMAALFFGSENPVGKQILRDKSPYIIKGVFASNPKFHLQFDYLISLSSISLPADRMQSWVWHQFFTYAKIKVHADVKTLEAKFQDYVKQKEFTSASGNIAVKSEDKPFFQPLRNIHLYSSSFKFDNAVRGNILYVNALTIIAGLILLIACFNFINLATAKSFQRAKEVGVRKAIGAAKRQLVFQFIGETILLAAISIIVSISLALFLLPWLNEFTDKNISAGVFANPLADILFIVLMLIVGMLAGFYPALVLARFKPIRVLKGSISGGEPAGGTPWLRHGLVITQFTLSVLLIISAMVVYKQVNYLHNKDLGFNKDQIMFFPMRGDNMFKNAEAFKNHLSAVPGVRSVSIGYGFPGDAVAGDEIIVPRNGKRSAQSVTQLTVDFDYLKTLGLEVTAGRDFSRQMSSDKDHAWIINETAVKQLGFGTPGQALGQDLAWHPWGASNQDSLKTGKIIGVVKDFNYKSLYDKVEPTVIQIFPDAAWKVAVKLYPVNISKTISGVANVWGKFSPDYPLEYKFLDQNFEQMYVAEDKLKSLLWIFTAVAIFVGCLGLVGLAAYIAERSTKEIGVRKVLGASLGNIVFLLSKDFIRLVIIAFLIASPVAWIVMNGWLQNFAYRTSISWWIFGLAGMLAVLLAFGAISFQAIKAALANPVKSLRSE